MPWSEVAGRKRNRLQVDERREQLLELGIRLFSDRSYEEIPIGEIAEAAGISKGLLYHYFPSKRDFYVEAVRHAAGQMLSSIEQATQGPDRGEVEGLRRGLDAYLDYVEDHAVAYSTLMKSGAADPDVALVVEQARGTFVLQISEGAGLLAPSPTVRVALRGWIGFVEAASLEWLETRAVARTALREVMVAALMGAAQAAAMDLNDGVTADLTPKPKKSARGRS
ncbi:MAG: TetR/AcrR family transcriptional regulator [Polyangiaceae bacterium]